MLASASMGARTPLCYCILSELRWRPWSGRGTSLTVAVNQVTVSLIREICLSSNLPLHDICFASSQM